MVVSTKKVVSKDFMSDSYCLRDYQQEMLVRIRGTFKEHRSVMVQMPTGTGKTVVMANCIGADKVLIVAHRIEILEQIRDTLRRYGLGERIDDSIRVESIQRLARKADLKKLPPCRDGGVFCPSLVIIDEAHHCTAKSYRKLWRWWPEAKFLGFTATPCRLKAEGFDALFDELLCSWNVSEFISKGRLSMFEYYAVKPSSNTYHSVNSLQERGADGDYLQSEMGHVMDNRASIDRLYRAYKDYADGRQGIVYAINREHALHIKEYYEEKGESVAVVDSETPKNLRMQTNDDYREGKVRILVNCEIYGEGYDAPFVQFIQLARPTLSLSKYLQQVGRGLRPHESKDATIILDCVGHCYLFGLPNDRRDWHEMFRYGQITGNGGRFPETGSRDFRYMMMQTGRLINVDDGHDHEMMQVMTVRDLRRELERESASTKPSAGTDPTVAAVPAQNYRTLLSKPYIDRVIKAAGGYALVEGRLHDQNKPARRFVVDTEGNTVYTQDNVEDITNNGIAICNIHEHTYDLRTKTLYRNRFIGVVRQGALEYLKLSATSLTGTHIDFITPRVGGMKFLWVNNLNLQNHFSYGECNLNDLHNTAVWFYHRSAPDRVYFVVGWRSGNKDFIVYDIRTKDFLLMTGGGRLRTYKRKADALYNGYYTTKFYDSPSNAIQKAQLKKDVNEYLCRNRTLNLDIQ